MGKELVLFVHSQIDIISDINNKVLLTISQWFCRSVIVSYIYD
jgi:hypothetical protein